MDKAIKKWKELGIVYAEFEFDCGGDSMGDTSITLYVKDGTVECEEVATYIDYQVYQNVQFYENSDGHYLGEHGTVHIELDDSSEDEDEHDLVFSKSSMSQFCESEQDTIQIPITKEESEYLREHVKDFQEDTYEHNLMEEDTSIFEYCKDFYKDVKLSKIEAGILEKIHNAIHSHTFENEPSEGEELNINSLDVDEGYLKFDINYSAYVERESSW